MAPSDLGLGPWPWLPPLFFLAALLYSAVGHGGASGYLAAMALLAFPPEEMRPLALTLNVLVSLIAAIRFGLAGQVDLRVFGWFAAGSVPFAALGGAVTLPGSAYRPLVGLVLVYAGCRLLWQGAGVVQASAGAQQGPVSRLRPWRAWAGGVGLGLLSGLTGVGGGIFLSPLLVLNGWLDLRRVAGTSACFILVNSLAGLAGRSLVSGLPAPSALLAWAGFAVALGGSLGSTWGSRAGSVSALRRLLAAVLFVAGAKLSLTA